ncbi:MAG TPA: ParB/RepB/Spo0J family partition protein [Steroidobacteraceae bacterium]|jgi:ParB family transcriptional regulator, chromosome partitioning protein|nr:ParB/RepB/Spo0J family partition protein [Steroidobacteraceae bacterium]
MATRTPARSPRKRTAGRSSNSRRRLNPSTRARGLEAVDIALAADHEAISVLIGRLRQAGGTVIGTYRDPLGGRPLVLATLPVRAIQPTPFQRDLSPTHTKRLAEKIDQAGAFLDPLIVVLGDDDLFWTPNGRHRLAAAKLLGLKQISVLISPDETLAYRILALNTEKAHNLKDRSLEVIRMARSLARREPSARESQFAEQFESAELLTLGIIYEQVPRFAGGAYGPMLKKVDRFSTRPLPAALREREGYAARLQAIETEVKKIVAGLQTRGFKSPYLRNYVVARINPVRFQVQKRGESGPAMPIGQALTRMTAAAKAFKLESVSNADLAWVAVGAGSHD